MYFLGFLDSLFNGSIIFLKLIRFFVLKKGEGGKNRLYFCFPRSEPTTEQISPFPKQKVTG